MINKPRDLTPEKHKEIFFKLVKEIESIRQGLGLDEDLRLRDWMFERSDGLITIQIFLDRSFKVKPPQDKVVGVKTCARIHRVLLESKIFEEFPNDVAMEISSAGAEPPLRSREDFLEAVGVMTKVAFWDSNKGKSIEGVLKKVEPLEDSDFNFYLDISGDINKVNINEVRSAWALVLSSAMPKRKKNK